MIRLISRITKLNYRDELNWLVADTTYISNQFSLSQADDLSWIMDFTPET